MIPYDTRHPARRTATMPAMLFFCRKWRCDDTVPLARVLMCFKSFRKRSDRWLACKSCYFCFSVNVVENEPSPRMNMILSYVFVLLWCLLFLFLFLFFVFVFVFVLRVVVEPCSCFCLVSAPTSLKSIILQSAGRMRLPYSSREISAGPGFRLIRCLSSQETVLCSPWAGVPSLPQVQ